MKHLCLTLFCLLVIITAIWAQNNDGSDENGGTESATSGTVSVLSGEAQIEEVSRWEDGAPEPLIQEEVSLPAEETELQEVEAEVESEPVDEEEDFRVKIDREEFSVIIEEGHYENLDREKLNWTVNNLFEHVFDFEIIRGGSPRKYSVNGHEIETDLYLNVLSRGNYGPEIFSSNRDGVIDYNDVIEEDGVYHMVLSREFIEAFIEASKYEEVTDELNEFIERINRIQSAAFENLTETQIDSLIYVDPRTTYELDLEEKREDLRRFLADFYFLPSNVFWIDESEELARILHPTHREPITFGEVIYYTTENRIPTWWLGEEGIYDILPPSTFYPHSHADPDSGQFIWVPNGTLGFIYDKQQWKIAAIKPGT